MGSQRVSPFSACVLWYLLFLEKIPLKDGDGDSSRPLRVRDVVLSRHPPHTVQRRKLLTAMGTQWLGGAGFPWVLCTPVTRIVLKWGLPGRVQQGDGALRGCPQGEEAYVP